MPDSIERPSELQDANALTRWARDMRDVIQMITDLSEENLRHRSFMESAQREHAKLAAGARSLALQPRLRQSTLQLGSFHNCVLKALDFGRDRPQEPALFLAGGPPVNRKSLVRHIHRRGDLVGPCGKEVRRQALSAAWIAGAKASPCAGRAVESDDRLS